MNKDFDFDHIGKQTPYRTPEDFFEQTQRKILEQTVGKQQRKRKLNLIVSATIAMAAVLTGLLFAPSAEQTQPDAAAPSQMLAVETKTTADPVDKWINELSDEELEELVNFSENDLFINQTIN